MKITGGFISRAAWTAGQGVPRTINKMFILHQLGLKRTTLDTKGKSQFH